MRTETYQLPDETYEQFVDRQRALRNLQYSTQASTDNSSDFLNTIIASEVIESVIDTSSSIDISSSGFSGGGGDFGGGGSDSSW